MKKRDEDPECSNFPLAYLITIRAYGTFLHGDDSAVDRHGHNIFGTPLRPQNSDLGRIMKTNMLTTPVIFTGDQCKIIEQAIKEVCTHRHYELWAVNARTNHAHAVVSAHSKPETIADAFKSYSTRRLREARLIGPSLHPWARGRSRRYLWKPQHVARAIEYVRFGQGEDIPSFDD
jgi:REP element-mobilizing transposase RayT